MHYEHLRVELKGEVAWVTIDRPDRLNALNTRLSQDLREFFSGLGAKSPARVVVLRASGRAFCAGYDLKDAQVQGRGVEEMLEVQYGIRDIMVAMRRCPQP